MSTALALTPLTGSVGAVVHIELRDVSPDSRQQLVDAWRRYGVLFFLDQHLTPAEQVDAARIFGEPELFEMAPTVEGSSFVHKIEVAARRRHGGTSTWHTDATWRQHPPRGSLLQAVMLPTLGGDTLFASAAAAYGGLSSGMQRYVDDLTATHAGGWALARASEKTGATVPAAVHHPVARVHPETGERCLFVNRLFTERIDDVPRPESDALLPMLCDQFKQPEYQCRFRWQVGDIAVWDNVAVQHYAAPDYDDPRLMHRVVLGPSGEG